jgi:hypothetical protein
MALAACAGWTTATALPGLPPWYLFLVGALAVAVGEVFRRSDAPRRRLLAAGELAGLVVIGAGPGLLAALFVGSRAVWAVAGVGFAFLVWLLSAATAADLAATVEPVDFGGTASTPTTRLSGRFWLLGVATTIALAAGHGPLAPASTARPLTAALVVPYLVFWLIGLAGLSAIHRTQNLARWRRDQAHVDDDLERRWGIGTLVLLAVAVIVVIAVIIPATTALNTGHSLFARGVGAISGWLGRITGTTPEPAVPRTPTEGTVPELPPPANTIDPPPEWWDAFLLVAVGTLFAMAYLLFDRRRRARIADTRDGKWWSSLLLTLWDIVKAIGGALATLFRRRRRPDQGAATGSLSDRADPVAEVWSPSDAVRRRIASEYRHFLTTASAVFGRPRPWETATEYGDRVTVGLPDPVPAVSLSDLYAEARFSHHVLTAGDAERAQLWRREVESRLVQH